ncbi:MAG: helix-turn-helix domain-containing protein [Polaromonas sp.]
MTDKTLENALHQLGSLQDLGRAMGLLRRRAKLSQAALGQMAGLSRMPVYRLEAGQDISLRSFLALLQALKLQLALRPAPNEPLRAADLKAAFAHLHADDDAP